MRLRHSLLAAIFLAATPVAAAVVSFDATIRAGYGDFVGEGDWGLALPGCYLGFEAGFGLAFLLLLALHRRAAHAATR